MRRKIVIVLFCIIVLSLFAWINVLAFSEVFFAEEEVFFGWIVFLALEGVSALVGFYCIFSFLIEEFIAPFLSKKITDFLEWIDELDSRDED